MSNDYAKNKVHQYAWNMKFPQKYKENNRIQNAKKNIKRTAWRQACKMYRFILIDEHH